MQINELVCDHTKEWSDMKDRHVQEQHEVHKEQIAQQNECLRKLFEDTQLEQIQELTRRLEKYVHFLTDIGGYNLY